MKDSHIAGDQPPATTSSRTRSAIAKAASGERSIHPALIPGVSVEDTRADFKTNKTVFAVALAATIGIIIWSVIAPDNLAATGSNLQSWVVQNFGWLFTIVMIAATIFLLSIAIAPTGKIKLGSDDSEPDFSRSSWIAMLFAAGLGIGLVFYGPMEPLSHFLTPPPYLSDVEPASEAAVLPAFTQAILHQATLPWMVYALVGGSLAYAAYRRGRLPLISSLFEPLAPDSNNRAVGKVVDIFSVLVTLFGTATSLGIGALQIRTGTSIITGKPLEGDGTIIAIITILTVVFIFSAMSGIQRGIRILSNINMGLVVGLGLFVLLTGPTLYILDLIPASILQFFNNFADMMSVAPSQGEIEKEFVTAWTMLYWAWWISWSPFVGMFIAKISRGRTIREFVLVIMLVPTSLSLLWYVIFGATAIKTHLDGNGIEIIDSGENVMFDVMRTLPLSSISTVAVLIAVIVFFNTAADSATNVMGSMSQSGRPVPSRPISVMWGAALGGISLALLLIAGEDALSGLQSIMVSCSLPFAFILIGVMVAWGKDLIRDPLIMRKNYAYAAIARGVEHGLQEHNGDFIFGSSAVPESQGAGADIESDDPYLHEWYTESATDEYLADQARTRDQQRAELEHFTESQEKDSQDDH
ncbi:BCCT family transporter [Corynebacterium aurimucosum]|uniref:BCCT family transporter n=1 Tax=Corynebacterium aurimucosum TaxID=169292 RepID=UPI0039907C37